MWKKLGITILILALVSLFMITPAEAGSKTRNRWQGAAIALGALALGGIVAHQIYANTPPPVAYYPPPPPPQPESYYYRPQPEYIPGHWEKVRELNGSREPGKESGCPDNMIDGATGWQATIWKDRLQAAMRREGPGWKGITGIIKS